MEQPCGICLLKLPQELTHLKIIQLQIMIQDFQALKILLQRRLRDVVCTTSQGFHQVLSYSRKITISKYASADKKPSPLRLVSKPLLILRLQAKLKQLTRLLMKHGLLLMPPQTQASRVICALFRPSRCSKTTNRNVTVLALFHWQAMYYQYHWMNLKLSPLTICKQSQGGKKLPTKKQNQIQQLIVDSSQSILTGM